MIQALQNSRNWLYFSIFFVQLILFTMVSLYAVSQWTDHSFWNQTLHRNLRIAGIPVGGLTAEEAASKLQDAIKASAGREIHFVLDGRSFSIDRTSLEITYDVDRAVQEAFELDEQENAPIQVSFNRAELSKQLDEIGKEIDRPAVSASAEVSGKTIRILPEVIGYRIDIDRSVASFEEFLSTRLDATRVELNVTVQQDVPTMIAKDLADINTFLADRELSVNREIMGRLENARKAVDYLNGAIVFPGEVFSFVDRTGPYTVERGYSPVEVVSGVEGQEQWAGGATQVASALYYALLKSQMPVIERHATQRPVDFTELGLEAQVNDNGLDLRFHNHTDGPVFIHAAMQDNRIRVALFGVKQDLPEVTIATETEKSIPPNTIVRVDPDLAPNQEIIHRKGSDGHVVLVYQTWREKNGTIVKKKVSYNYYKPLHNIIAVGPVMEEKEEPAGIVNHNDSQPPVPSENTTEWEEPAANSNMSPPDIPEIPVEENPATVDSTGEVRVDNGIIYQN